MEEFSRYFASRARVLLRAQLEYHPNARPKAPLEFYIRIKRIHTFVRTLAGAADPFVFIVILATRRQRVTSTSTASASVKGLDVFLVVWYGGFYRQLAGCAKYLRLHLFSNLYQTN